MTDQEITEAEIKAKRNAYASVFSGDAGKLVLADLKRVCMANRTSVDAGQIDPYRVVYRQGMANIYYEIERMIKKGKL